MWSRFSKKEVGNYGNRAKWSKRILINAVRYLDKTGCQWELLPNDFPPYTTVSSFFHRAKVDGIWEEINRALVEADRVQKGRSPEPSYALIDSQSAKTTGAADERGYDGGKKVKGRKRHITTDIEGNLLCVVVHAANIPDTISGCNVIQRTLKRYHTIKGVSGDAGFRGTFKEYAESLRLSVDIAERITPGWSILPKRWRVERSFGWCGNSRRLSKDYETSTWSEESHIYVASSFVLLDRLFPAL